MNLLFLRILNMSISASWLVLAVLALRLVLKKAPKWTLVLLWGIVAVRLICPFSFESALSLIPSSETISPTIMTDQMPSVQTGIPAVNHIVNPVIGETFAPTPGDSTNPLQIWIPVLNGVWLAGAAALLMYIVISYWRLRRKVWDAVLLRENIYQSEHVASPFVLGIIRPKVYIPYHMDGKNMEHVVAHEQAHIRRKDHWWKPFGFLLLTIHWFNPLMWLAYVLLCRDIELACDEKVIKELDNQQRADYTQALVACSVNRRMIAACPLAFGEVSVKERVKSVMNYKKPAFWWIAIALIVCAGVGVCFLTNPNPAREFVMTGNRVSDLNPEAIVEYILNCEDWHSSNIYVNANNFSMHVDAKFNWMDSQTVQYFFSDAQKNYRAQLRIFPEEGKYYLTEPSQWPMQDRIFLLRHYLEAIKYLPQQEIRQIAPADQYMIQLMDGGSPADYERVITYSAEGAGEIDGWFIHLRLQPLHKVSDGYNGVGEEIVELFYGEAGAVVSDTVVKWFDYFAMPSEMNWEGSQEITVPQFPDVTFRWSYGTMEAVVGENAVRLYSGMPIWSAYFYDLTGDGLPELCSTISFGSGMIDDHIVVYDYANGVSYTLADRGNFDYSIRLEEDGLLYADKRSYYGGELVASGRLMFRNDSLHMLGQTMPSVEILNIIDPTDNPDFSYDTVAECIYSDTLNDYFIGGAYSRYIIVSYTDGTQEDIVSALKSGRATVLDLDKFGIRYWEQPKANN